MLKNFYLLISYFAPSSLPLLIVCDLNADPGIIPCLAKGTAAGRFVNIWLWLIPKVRDRSPRIHADLSLMMLLGPGGIYGCLPHCAGCFVYLSGGSLLPFLSLLISGFVNGLLRCLAPVPLSLLSLHVGFFLLQGFPVYLRCLWGGVVGCLS